MQISTLINNLREGNDVSLGNTGFSPDQFDEIRLETGETVYVAEDKKGLILGVDPTSEEVYLFESVDEEVDVEEDMQVYDGEDFEFSLETSGNLLIEEEEGDAVTIRDYESSSGRLMRVIEYSVTGDIAVMVGRIVSEDEIQEAA